MTTRPPATLDKWNSLESQSRDLFTTLLKENEDFKAQIRELTEQAAIYKTASNAAIRERDEARETAATLNDIHDHNPLAVALIDGDGYIFHPDYIQQGRSGGHNAATRLSHELLSAAGRRLQLFAAIYLNRSGLCDVLLVNQLITHKAVFDDFIVGFNQASPLLSIVDVGYGKEAADAKLKEMLRIFSDLPQVKFLCLGVANDGGYAHNLASLSTGGLLDKVMLLEGYSDMPFDIRRHSVPVLRIPNLFLSQKLPTRPQLTPMHPPMPPPIFQMPQQSSSINVPPGGNSSYRVYQPGSRIKNARPIDASKHVLDQTPKACNSYYLKKEGCSLGEKCIFAHDYEFTLTQLTLMRQTLKRILCKKQNCSGKECPYMHPSSTDGATSGGATPSHLRAPSQSESAFYFDETSSQAPTIDDDDDDFDDDSDDDDDDDDDVKPSDQKSKNSGKGRPRVPKNDSAKRAKYDKELCNRATPYKIQQISKLTPAPCKMFYLHHRGCKHNQNCPRSHKYTFSKYDLNRFREEMAAKPCTAKNCKSRSCVNSHKLKRKR